VTLRVKNSTGYDVVGILGRVPRKWLQNLDVDL
jgi:hypothetical protein